MLSESREACADFIEAVLAQVRKNNVYRAKVISLECAAQDWGSRGCAQVRFHRVARIRGEDIVLPAEIKTLLERNTVGFYQQAEVLRRSGRAVRRGILLHGKPGTGKTYTARWLAQSLKDVTVILLSGEQLALVKQCCQMARLLAPALVIMEDVDLIATPRDTMTHPFSQISLHQLLNEMDGVTSEAEIIFLLTTNRPEAIEAALAARPGRIDQAIEFPLPDLECRRQLFELYGRGLAIAVNDVDRLLSRLEGASPAFIKELMRKAALLAAEDGSRESGVLRVTDAHCDASLRELVLGGGELTRKLFGFGADGEGTD